MRKLQDLTNSRVILLPISIIIANEVRHMKNENTGAFIKELRSEKGLTQKALAELLHITDTAVSKWERGLCAPDISMLEPLAKALDVTVIEIINGNRIIVSDCAEGIEVTTKSLIAYSKIELENKTRSFKKKYLFATAACVALGILICLFSFWRNGRFDLIDKTVSPDSKKIVSIYDRDIFSSAIVREKTVAILMKSTGKGEHRTTYGNCTYQGLYWAPDSKKYVLSLKYAEETQLALAWLERNSESNLNAYLSIGVSMNELEKYGFRYGDGDTFPEIKYEFLQWSMDSSSMLIYYSFTDIDAKLHSGYFWYDCEEGKVYAPFELDANK